MRMTHHNHRQPEETVAGQKVEVTNAGQSPAPQASRQTLPIRTGVKAGVGEEVGDQIQTWWQNLTSQMTPEQS